MKAAEHINSRDSRILNIICYKSYYILQDVNKSHRGKDEKHWNNPWPHFKVAKALQQL